MGSWVKALALIVLVSACRGTAKPTPVGSTSAVAPPSATASVAPTAAASGTPAALTLDAPCKALGKKGSTELSPIPEAEVQLFATPEALYALGFTHELARSRLYRFSRAGGPLEMVAEQKGLGDRKPFVVVGGAAYYVQAGKLIRLGPKSGESTVLFDGLHSPVAVVGSRVLGVACDSKAKADRLLELPVTGGEPQLVAELPKAPGDTCQYSSLVADERDVFIADWKKQQVLAVSRADKTVRSLVSKRGFPGELQLGPDGLAYLSTAGLERVARDGGAKVKLADPDIALGPYSVVAANATHFFAADNLAYSMATTLRRLPRAGGAAQSLLVLKNADPTADVISGQGFWDFVVDEQCVYVAQTQYRRAGVQLVVKAL